MLELLILLLFGMPLLTSSDSESDDDFAEPTDSEGGTPFLDLLDDAEDDLETDEDQDNDPPETEDPYVPVFEVTENDDGSVNIELGADETGSIVALKVEDEFIDTTEGDSFATYTLGFYHLPAGNSVETPDSVEQSGEGTLAGLIAQAGLYPLTSFDLGNVDKDVDPSDGSQVVTDNRVEPPTITSSQDIQILRVESLRFSVHEYIEVVQEDETYSPFEEVIEYYDGNLPIQAGAGETLGTTGNDWLNATDAAADGGTLQGLDGDDLITIGAANMTAFGGEGDDTLRAAHAGDEAINGTLTNLDNATLYGGGGDDTVFVNSGSTGYGDAGNDYLDAYFDQGDTDPALIYGGTGNDILAAYGPTSTAYGGEDDDTITIDSGATGHGDDGDDLLTVDVGSVAFGGAGDDEFTVYNFLDEGPAPVVTGGDGADEFKVWPRGWDDGGTTEFLQITDFNAAEDTLVVETISIVSNIAVAEAADGSQTTVTLTLVPSEGSYLEGETYVTIQLDGVTGFTADQVEVA